MTNNNQVNARRMAEIQERNRPRTEEERKEILAKHSVEPWPWWISAIYVGVLGMIVIGSYLLVVSKRN
jgi:hypothetical protein